MLSIDANILLYAFNTASPWHEAAIQNNSINIPG